MSTTETAVTARRTTHDRKSATHAGWLLRVFPEPNQRSIVLRAVLLTGVILGLEYLVEVVWLDLSYWQEWDPFFTDPGVPLSALGLLFTLVLLGQWGARYPALWAEVRPAFDVPDPRYDAVVRECLGALYGRDHVPFLLFAVVQVGVYALFPAALPAGYLHVGFLHFFAVTALYCGYRHVATIQRVTDLDLVGVSRARPTLSAVADFGVIVVLNWFAALALLLVYVGFFLRPGLASGPLDALMVDVGSFYALAGLALVAVGVLLFVVPVVLLHEALAAAKRDRLHAIETEYETLFEAWREDDLDGDPSVGLDLLEKRRRNAEARSTWPYRLVSVGQVLLGSVVPAAVSVAQALP
ncbi:MAG: hypothetical protein V5A60_04970 [Haloarculaceae archaeon]